MYIVQNKYWLKSVRHILPPFISLMMNYRTVYKSGINFEEAFENSTPVFSFNPVILYNECGHDIAFKVFNLW